MIFLWQSSRWLTNCAVPQTLGFREGWWWWWGGGGAALMWIAAEVQVGKQEPLFSSGLMLIGSGMPSWQASRPQPPPAMRAWWTANSGNNPKFSWKESSRPWKICWDPRDSLFFSLSRFSFSLFASKNVHRCHRFRSLFSPCARRVKLHF